MMSREHNRPAILFFRWYSRHNNPLSSIQHHIHFPYYVLHDISFGPLVVHAWYMPSCSTWTPRTPPPLPDPRLWLGSLDGFLPRNSSPFSDVVTITKYLLITFSPTLHRQFKAKNKNKRS
jgi:hypothetical protein